MFPAVLGSLMRISADGTGVIFVPKIVVSSKAKLCLNTTSLHKFCSDILDLICCVETLAKMLQDGGASVKYLLLLLNICFVNDAMSGFLPTNNYIGSALSATCQMLRRHTTRGIISDCSSNINVS